DIPTKAASIDSVEYSPYASKEAFIGLKKSFPNLSFYRDDDKILLWKNSSDSELPENSLSINIDFTEKAKVLTKILERSIIDYVEQKGYQIFKNKHSNSWEIISPKDVLNGSIEGLSVNRIVYFSPCFFFKESKLLLGFSLSTSLKNSFTWSKSDFEKYGIDIKGLKGDEDRIFANRQSIKRFLETKGATAKYDQIIRDRKSTRLNSSHVKISY